MKFLLDLLIGWNEGSAERCERKGATYRRREAFFRGEYRDRFPNPWRQA